MKPLPPKVAAAADVLSRLLLGGIFIYAAWSKIQDPAIFADAVDSYRMLPQFAVSIVALVLPMIELTAGVALLVTRWPREAAVIMLGMLGMFFIGLSQAALRGLDISCGCFGGDHNGAGDSIYAALLRDIFLFLPVLWLLYRPNRWLVTRGVGLGLAGALVVLGGILLFRTPTASAVASNEEANEEERAPKPEIPLMEQMPDYSISGEPLDDTVKLGQWTKNYPAALARAQTEHRPLLMVLTSKRCPYCKRLWTSINNKMFRQWVKEADIYLTNASLAETNKAPAQYRMARQLMKSSVHHMPLVGVYWPKVGDRTNDVYSVFAGRYYETPGTRHASLTLEMTSALDKLLAEYLTQRGVSRSSKALLAKTAKKVSFAIVGEGKVVMKPASGELLNNGHPVRLVAKPAKGYAFVGWRNPANKPVKRQYGYKPRELNVSYNMSGGTYTAIFRKKVSKKDKTAPKKDKTAPAKGTAQPHQKP